MTTQPALGDHVAVEMKIIGEVVGRTHEASPRYDIKLADGRIIPNIPAQFVEAQTLERAR